MSKATDTDHSVALPVAKVTIDTERHKFHNYVWLLGAICEFMQFINCAAHFVDW